MLAFGDETFGKQPETRWAKVLAKALSASQEVDSPELVLCHSHHMITAVI